MIAGLEIVAGLAAYGFVGLLWARTQAVRLQRDIAGWESHRREGCWHYSCPYRPWFGDNLKKGLGLHVTLWPLTVIGLLVLAILFTICDLISKTLDFATAPVDKQRTKAQQLRDEAQSYKDTADNTNVTPEERKLLNELANALMDKAKLVDL